MQQQPAADADMTPMDAPEGVQLVSDDNDDHQEDEALESTANKFKMLFPELMVHPARREAAHSIAYLEVTACTPPMSGGDGLPPSSSGIAGGLRRPVNNTRGKPLTLTVAFATWGKPR